MKLHAKKGDFIQKKAKKNLIEVIYNNLLDVLVVFFIPISMILIFFSFFG